MTRARAAKGVAAAVLLLVVGTSCSGTDEDPANDPTAVVSPAESGSPSATPPSESEAASDAAAQVVREYYATFDELGQRPRARLGKLSSVASGVQLTSAEVLLRSQRSNGERQVGNTEIAELEVQSVNLDNSDPDAGIVPTIQIDVCWDVANVDVVDERGQSIVSANRPDTGWTRLTVTNRRYENNPRGAWRVATGEDLEKASCVAS